MKIKNLFVVALASIVALAACKKEPVVTPPVDRAIKLNASVYGFTKATDTAFEAGDAMGVNVYKGEESYVHNAKFTYNGSALTSTTTYTWYEETETLGTIVAYYPYATLGETATSHTFTVNADQSTENNYKGSDFMVAKTTSLPTDDAVILPFKHALSKVVITVTNNLNEDIKDVFFTDVLGSVTFDLQTAEVAATGSKGDIKAYKSGANTWQLILAPQTATPELALTTASGKQYTFVLTEGVTFSAGKYSTAEVTVNNTTISTSFTPNIENWVADNELNFGQNEIIDGGNTEGEGDENGDENGDDNGEDNGENNGEDNGENEGEGNGENNGTTLTECKLIIRVNKAINWYDKYIYAWDANETKLCGEWPGTKTGWVGEDGNYYVYYHNFDSTLDGSTINYIINGGGQTNDLTVTLNGAETTVTIEETDLKQ